MKDRTFALGIRSPPLKTPEHHSCTGHDGQESSNLDLDCVLEPQVAERLSEFSLETTGILSRALQAEIDFEFETRIASYLGAAVDYPGGSIVPVAHSRSLEAYAWP